MDPRSATLPPLASGGGRYEPNESPSYLSCSKCIESTTHTRKTFLDFHIGVYQPCPDLKRTLVAMSERTGMSVSRVTDEVLYAGLVEMQEL